MKLMTRAVVVALAVAATMFVSTPARADILLIASGIDIQPSNPTTELFVVQTISNNLGDGFDLDFFKKFDQNGDPTADPGAEAEFSKVDVDVNGEGNFDIEWAGLVNWDLQYLLVKYGNLYALYKVINNQQKDSNGEQIIDTSQYCEQGCGISHISLFGTQDGTTVPEPTTLLLLGAGLVGTVAFARRRK